MPPDPSGRGPERAARAVAFALSAVSAVTACDPAGSRGGDAAAPTEAAAPAPPTGAAAARKPARCRVVMGEGMPANVDLDGWVDLPAGASLVVRTTESARELRYVGPGRALPCPEGGVAVLTAGTVSAMRGSGEAPGNEQWVATPCGVARWTTGAHRVEVTDRGCVLRAAMGPLLFTPAEDVSVSELPADLSAGDASTGGAARAEGGAFRLDGRVAIRAVGAGPPSGGAASAKLSCERASLREEKAAALLLAGGDGGSRASLGAQTVDHVEARRAARAACAVWRARVNGG